MKKLITIISSILISLSIYSQCSTATPFILDTCITINNNGPVELYYTFNIITYNEVQFSFNAMVTAPSCSDYMFLYLLYDENCNLIDTNTTGNFFPLSQNTNYIIGYTADCPYGGLISQICIDEISALPIELSYFKGTQEKGKITLYWETYSESNNSHFIVETSTDLITWIRLSNVYSLGNSSTPQNYSYKHDNPIDGINYYRLMQVDYTFGTCVIGEVIGVLYVKPTNKNVFLEYNLLGQKILAN